MTFSHHTLIVSVCALALLTGCDKTQEMLGLKREQPDEYTLMSRPPLSAPPGIALAPPQPGAKPLNATDASQEAQEQLGVKADMSSHVSSAEKALLSKAHVEDENMRPARPELEEADEDDVPYLFGNDSAKKKDLIDPKLEKKKYKDKDVATSGPAS